MLLAAALLASIVVGPELTPPPTPTTPAYGWGTAVAALSGGNFVALWIDNELVAAQAIADAPLRRMSTIVGSGTGKVSAAAIGDRVFAAWPASNRHAVSWVILDPNTQVLAKGDIEFAGASYVYDVAVTAVGDRYLLAALTDDALGGVFIDTNGRLSPLFRVAEAKGSSIAAASDGSRALLAVGSAKTVTTMMMDGNGVATGAGSIDTDNVQSICAAWDGGGYALAWWVAAKQPFHSLAWTDANGTPLAAPLQIAVSWYGPLLVGNAPGVTLFTRLSRNVYVRYGIGGKLLENPQTLPVAFDAVPVAAAAFNGSRYYVVAGASRPLTGAATDLVSASTPVPLAFDAPEVRSATVAVGDHQSFLGWRRADDNARIVRFKEGAFSDETVTHPFDLLVADGDGVAVATAKRAELVDASGALSSTVALPEHSTTSRGAWAGTRLPDGRLLVATAEYNNRGGTDLWATTFDRTRVIDDGIFVPDIVRTSPQPITVNGSGGVAAWIDENSRGWIARFDDGGIRIRSAIPFDVAETYLAAMAVDGDGHALIMAKPNRETGIILLLVDLTTMTIVRRTSLQWPLSTEMAWTGEEYVIASPQLDLLRISHDGVPLGAPMHLVPPYPPRDVRLASGPAGTLLVYTRLAPELGAGTVYRPFVRELRPSRRRLALH